MAAKIQDGRQYLENRLVQCVQTIEICEFIGKYGTRNAPDVLFWKQQYPLPESKMAVKIQDGPQYLDDRLVQFVPALCM